MGQKGVDIQIRQQIIGLLKDQTRSNVEIAKLVGVSEKCVRTTRKNFQDKNVVGEMPKSKIL